MLPNQLGWWQQRQVVDAVACQIVDNCHRNDKAFLIDEISEGNIGKKEEIITIDSWMKFIMYVSIA
jgi:hypothetical protein